MELFLQNLDFDKLCAKHLSGNDARTVIEAAHHLSINGIQVYFLNFCLIFTSYRARNPTQQGVPTLASRTRVRNPDTIEITVQRQPQNEFQDQVQST